ncbi:MAG: sodium:solute symporter family protein [Chlamydiales bacterium]
MSYFALSQLQQKSLKIDVIFKVLCYLITEISTEEPLMILSFVLFYFVILLIIGFLCRGKIHSIDDYFLAGRALPTYIAVPSIVATWFGAGSCLGVSAAMYRGGIQEIIPDPFGCSLALLICACFFAAPLRKRGFISINDFIKERYGRSAEVFCSAISLPFYVGTLAAQMVAIGMIINQLTDFPINSCIIASSCVIITYTLLGGLWAVAITDGFQLGIFVLCLIILVYPIATDHAIFADTFQIFYTELPEILPKSHPEFGYWSYYGQWLMTGMGALIGQDLMQRILACKNEKVAKRSTFLAGIMYLVICMIPILLGIYGRSLNISGAGEGILSHIVFHHYHSAIYALFVVSILSVTMSTADSYLLAGVTVLMQNILPKRNLNYALRLARIASCTIAMIAAFVAIGIRDVYAIMVHSGVFLFIALFVPICAGLYCKRVYKLSCWGSMVAGIGVWASFLIFYSMRGAQDFEALLYAAALVGMLSSLISYLGIHWTLSLKEKSVIKPATLEITQG